MGFEFSAFRLLRLTPKMITVDRSRFRLTLWRMRGNRYAKAKQYTIALGALGHITPAGPYFVNAKTREPDWNNPATPEYDPIPYEEPWTGDPIHPGNPFDGGFISLGGNPSAKAEGVGIHGVKFEPRLGERASHGCIRMATPDLLDIYDLVDIGTPVFIHQ